MPDFHAQHVLTVELTEHGQDVQLKNGDLIGHFIAPAIPASEASLARRKNSRCGWVICPAAWASVGSSPGTDSV